MRRQRHLLNSRSGMLIGLTLTLMIGAGLTNASTDLLIADFEGRTFAPWTSEGEAFGPGPVRDRLVAWNQPRFRDLMEGKAANSFHGDQHSEGVLRSAPFRIGRDFINIRLGGTAHPTDTCVVLLVDGEEVRRSTPVMDNIRGWHVTMRWDSWDVRKLKGRIARIEIRDHHFYGWIVVEHIEQSDASKVGHASDSIDPWQPGRFTKRIGETDRYLLIPIERTAPLQRIRVEIDGERRLEFYMQLAQEEAEDYLPVYDLTAHVGEKLNVAFASYPDSRARELWRVSDRTPGLAELHDGPWFHVTTRTGWLNDPNGMVYYDGEYHLFHQYTAMNMRGKHWSHWVSDDLVHWRELPIALFPDKLGSMHSGSAVVDGRNTAGFQTGPEKPIVAVFTGSRGMGGRRKTQVQGLAYSNDRGRTFTKYEGNPVIGEERRSIMNTDNNRDPKVIWHEATQRWVMALFERRGISIFTSPNLLDWTFRSHTEDFHECPEVFELPVDGNPDQTRWVMFGGSAQYAIGRFDGERFHTESRGERLAKTRPFYASQTFTGAPDGRRIIVGWTGAQLSFPAELTLRSTEKGILMYCEPVAEIRHLYERSYEISPRPLNDRNVLDGITGQAFDIDLAVDLGEAHFIDLTVRGLSIRYDVKSETLSVGNQSAAVPLVGGRLIVRAVIDRTSVEVYAADGRVFMPTLVKLADGPKTLSLTAEGLGARISRLHVHRLKSAWE